MGIILGGNQYGKAENRIVRFVRDTPRHEIRDINVTTALRGPFEPAYLVGDQSNVLPTDTQKNTAYAYAKTEGVESIEAYGLALARHFVRDVEPVEGARIEIEQYDWDRVSVGGVEHDHTWVRKGQEVRTAAITVDATGEHVIGGFKDLVILKSTGSEFADFLVDEFTTLEPTHDRVMATSLVAEWRFGAVPADWNTAYDTIKQAMVEQFAIVQSLALQQTLWHMGKAAIEAVPELVEVRLKAPNKHHFLYDLERFGIENNGEVFHADDRPYGLIEATVTTDDAPPAGDAWLPSAGLA
ncbi:urate oxidase [Microbacteriaceae bacterium SG_E_30_P1]|uniref:Uricase n=1 Tax=Antiquaquibacter oligotrophicus TaxID=2880260 RepID=A0ABT6KNJ2_9MICO|nr:urate oxidase [Antiquaquibacter oligotrophicus]MDH6181575.1 urate oxidase [Antiquaquibacter oligotrophicus]UDF12738.1 urate oxidase [Antiquaquibacter oligotrophicus]